MKFENGNILHFRSKLGAFRTYQMKKIVDAITDIVADRSRYTNMSHAARQHFDENFRRSVHLKRLISTVVGTDDFALTDFDV